MPPRPPFVNTKTQNPAAPPVRRVIAPDTLDTVAFLVGPLDAPLALVRVVARTNFVNPAWLLARRIARTGVVDGSHASVIDLRYGCPAGYASLVTVGLHDDAADPATWRSPSTRASARKEAAHVAA